MGLSIMDIIQFILAHLALPFAFPSTSNQRIYFLYLLTAAAMAYLVFQKEQNHKGSFKGFLSYLFPKEIYRSKSALNDVGFFIISKILFFALIFPILLSSTSVSHFTQAWFVNIFGPSPEFHLPLLSMALLFTFASVLVADLGIFFAHYLQHKVPLFWQFHKVHHSALVLTPMTVYRMHPVDDIIAVTCVAFLSGVNHAVFAYLLPTHPPVITVLSLNIFVFIYYFLGYNLRHSHIWLTYPKWLNFILISPAQHQIHHSSALEHRDKNIGFIFSFWDRLFGCLVTPTGPMKLNYGLSHGEEKEFSTVWKLLWLPFQKAFQMMTKGGKIFSLVFFLLLPIPVQAAEIRATVFLEDLTWTEVRQLIHQGYKNIIIPTGGTEQNGHHMILGKHNYIVKHTAEKIALELGNTLVAPVMAYVPEGNIDPPTGHMNFAGTISISEDTFEEVLKSATKSFIQHGFTYIFYLGDSGGNQKSQEKVAYRLNKFYQPKVRVANLSDYYKKNGQISWLESQGETLKTIGNHAGIRDTSELMFVHPQGIRRNKLKGSEDKVGVSGDATKASKVRGEVLIEYKIRAAVKQAKKILA